MGPTLPDEKSSGVTNLIKGNYIALVYATNVVIFCVVYNTLIKTMSFSKVTVS